MSTETTLHAPWGTVTPDFWHTDDPTPTEAVPAAARPAAEPGAPAEIPPPPAQYQWRIAAVTAAFAPPVDPQRLAAANLEAEALDEEFTAAFGAVHSHTIQVRELRGWIAHLMGHPAVAARWYLHTAGLQAQAWGPAHAFTRGSAERAVQHWRGVTDPAERHALATELLPLLAVVTGESSAAHHAVRAALDPAAG